MDQRCPFLLSCDCKDYKMIIFFFYVLVVGQIKRANGWRVRAIPVSKIWKKISMATASFCRIWLSEPLHLSVTLGKPSTLLIHLLEDVSSLLLTESSSNNYLDLIKWHSGLWRRHYKSTEERRGYFQTQESDSEKKKEKVCSSVV